MESEPGGAYEQIIPGTLDMCTTGAWGLGLGAWPPLTHSLHGPHDARIFQSLVRRCQSLEVISK